MKILIYIVKLYSRILLHFDPLLVKLKLTFPWVLPKLALKLAQRGEYTPSVYDIWLKTNWNDSTFVLGVTGRWGFHLHDYLVNMHSGSFVFVDVGANFGTYSIISAKNSNCEKVFSIEPNPRVNSQLVDNVSKNLDDANKDKVEILDFGIAESNSVKQLSFKENHLGAGNLLDRGGDSIQISTRDYSAFDDIFEKINGCPVFMKIDVEGYEPEVIRQLLKSHLATVVEYIFIEVSPSWLSDNELEKMLMNINDMGLLQTWRSVGHHQYDAYYSKNDS